MFSLTLKHPIVFRALLTEAQSIHGTVQKCFNYDKNIFSSALTVRTFLTRSIRLSGGLMQPANLKPNKLSQNLLVRHQQTLTLDVNTNVQNNVILYKNINDRYYRNLKIFAFGQLFGWSVLAIYTYTSEFFNIFKTEYKEFLKKHIFRFSMFAFSIIAGPVTFAFMYATCARNIKYVILNKGGKTLSLITHHMWTRKSNMINLPVEMVQANSHRKDLGICIPLKIKNRAFYYLIDKKGTFVNPNLFDYVLG